MLLPALIKELHGREEGKSFLLLFVFPLGILHQLLGLTNLFEERQVAWAIHVRKEVHAGFAELLV